MAGAQVMDKPSFGHQQDIKKGELESAKAQMGRVREENDRLKTMLGKIEKDYESLRLRFEQQSSMEGGPPPEVDLVSLCLGMNGPKMIKNKEDKPSCKSIQDLIKTGLSLRLMSTELEKSLEDEQKEEVACPPSKMQRSMTSGDDEVSRTKRSRVCVRARCDTPTMNDGCQWRKYGQKTAKANPCPRAYYRCTVAPGCPVRKQVQRCVDDMSILITTYEGTHNHSLPMSATGMASTTSAASSMLLSGPTTTQTLNVPYYNNPNPRTNSATQQLYMHNSSSSPLPTLTLDLTSSPYSHLNMFPSSTQRHSPTNMGLESNKVLGFGNMSEEKLYEPNIGKAHQGPQELLTETLTRAITSDPSLRSAIATAISSMVGDVGSNGNQKQWQSIVG